MKAKAFVFITTATTKTSEVILALRKLEGVKSADSVTGPYDIIAVVEAENLDTIGVLITDKIHPIAGILRTVTCLAI